MNENTNKMIEETVDEQLNNSGKPFFDRRVAPDADHLHTEWKEQQRNAHGKEKGRERHAREIGKDEDKDKDDKQTKTDQTN